MDNTSTQDLQRHLKDTFGFSEFKQGQRQVIQKILSGDSVAAIFPTGAGKSLCYQLPAVLLPGITLVVSPLLSLMHDQLEFLRSHGIAAASLDSTLSREQYHDVLTRAEQGTLKVLMISVERFRNERFRNHLSRMKISLMVVDEAHCISEWGHNFRPEYLKLPLYKKEFSIQQSLLLTATATQTVADDICRKFEIPADNCVRTGFHRKNLKIRVHPVKEPEKLDHLVGMFRDKSCPLPAIVYVTLQKSAERVAAGLAAAGIPASAYHAGMGNEQRAQVQNSFMAGAINCVVATIAFGMGIDKSDIRTVIHFDLPKSIEGYSQEIGRAGRDGKESRCVLFANRSCTVTLRNFVYGDTPEKQSLRILLDEILQAGPVWETQLLSLSNATNIRQLPLKTALVYLEIEGVVAPMYSYFAQYRFRTDLTGAQILSRFTGEKAAFLKKLLSYSQPKRTWIDIDLVRFVEDTGFDRKRAIAALEYLDGSSLIELAAKQAVDVYRVMRPQVDTEALAEKLHRMFLENERYQLNRITEMVSFFENRECLSFALARYFGETMSEQGCGHCSVCTDGPVKMEAAARLSPPESYDIQSITREIAEAAGDKATPLLLAKFLCGISTPLFTRVKAGKMSGFGMLEAYPYEQVYSVVNETLPLSAV